MGFDAGKIEGTLEVDRTPFTRGLAAARRQGQRFANETFTASMDVDTKAANASIRALRAQMARAGSLARHMQVTADTSGATAAMRAVEAQQRRLQAAGGTSTVGVDTALASARIAALEAQLERLSRTTATPKVQPRGFGQALAQVQWLQVALIGLGPAAVPVLATMTAQTVALAGALGAAAAGAGVLGLAVGGQVVKLMEITEQIKQLDDSLSAAEPGSARFNELMAQRTELMASLSPQQAAVIEQWGALAESAKEFGDPAQAQILEAITNALVGARSVLTTLQPAVVPLAETFLTLSERFRDFAEGPAMSRFAQWVQTTGPPAIMWLVQTLVNLGATLFNIGSAFWPLTEGMMTAEGSFARLREWSEGLAVNPQFQEFLSYVQANGPLVWSTLGSIASALLQVGWALAPLAPPLLEAIGAVAEFTAQTAAAHPWVIQLAWAGLLVSRLWGPLAAGATLVKTALQSQAAAWLLAKTRMVAYNVTMRIIRAATVAWTAVQWALNVAMSANPIGLIVLAVIAFIAYIALIVVAIKYAWENFDWFRNSVLFVWEAIKAGALWLWENGIKPVVDWIVDAFRNYVAPAALWLWTNGIQPVFEWIVGAFQNYVLPAITFFVGMWQFYFGIIWTVLKTVWSFIWPVLQFIGLVAFALIVTALGVLWSYWKFVFNVIATVVTWLWKTIIKPAVDGIVWLWVNWLLPQIQKFRAQWKLAMEGMGIILRWLQNNVVRPVLDWINTKWKWLVAQFNFHKAMISAIFVVIGGYINLLRDRFKLGIDRIKSFVSGLVASLRGFRDSAREIFKKAANYARTPINWVINTVYNDGIRKVARNVLTAVGMTSLADKIPRAATIPAFAAGGAPMDPSGYVRGAGSATSDSIFARIANREFVVNARATRIFRPILEWMNNAGRRAAGNRAAAMPGGVVPGLAQGGMANPFALARDAVLGASKEALTTALDALGFRTWVNDLKAGAPIWKGGAGGALAMTANGLLDFLGKQDAKGGGALQVVRQARKARMDGSDADNRFTRAFGMIGAPWCAMFVSEMIREARAQKLYANVRSAAVQSFATSSMKSVSTGAARAGDLAVYRGSGGPGGWSHINIVTDPKKKESIGGNESNRIRKQYGYYPSAVKLMRPGAASGGLITDRWFRMIMAQDRNVNTKATTPADTQFLRVLAGLPAYGDGGEVRPVQYRASGGTLKAGDVSWTGERGPELVEVGAGARVRSAGESAEVLAEAIARALVKAGVGGRGGDRTINVEGAVTTPEFIEQLIRRLRAEDELAAAAGTAGLPPKPRG